MWEIGQELPVLEKPPFTKEQLAEYAQASGDMNPIHLEDAFAKEAGFPSVIAHGMISMAYMADYIALNFPKEKYQINRFRSRFRKVNFPGDQLTCEGKIKKVLPEGKLLVVVGTRNTRGELTTDGEAEITCLPAD